MILFKAEEQDFDNYGFGVLSDSVEPDVTRLLSGGYELEFQYPITGVHYSDIQIERIVFCKPSPTKDPQPFRIDNISKPIRGIVTVHAYHISYDLSKVLIRGFRATSAYLACSYLNDHKNQFRLHNPNKPDEVIDPVPFAFSCPYEKTGEMKVDEPRSIRSLMSGSDETITGTFKGEWDFGEFVVGTAYNRYFSIMLLERVGAEKPVMTIAYGKNMTDITAETDSAKVYKYCYPYWKGTDGVYAEVDNESGCPPHTFEIQNGSGKGVYALDLTNEFETKPTSAQLKEKALEKIEEAKIGIPTENIEVSFVPGMERLNIGDAVEVIYEAIGVKAVARCVETHYNPIKNIYTNIVVGEAKTTAADTINNQFTAIEEVPKADYIHSVIQSEGQKIAGNMGGFVRLHDKDNDGYPDELVITDTLDLESAQHVWRWNQKGLGYSNGYNEGDWSLAITQDGVINADFIRSGRLQSVDIIGTNMQIGYWEDSAGHQQYSTGSIVFRENVRDWPPDRNPATILKIDSNGIQCRSQANYEHEINLEIYEGRIDAWDRTEGHRLSTIEPAMNFVDPQGTNHRAVQTISDYILFSANGFALKYESEELDQYRMTYTGSGSIPITNGNVYIDVFNGFVTGIRTEYYPPEYDIPQEGLGFGFDGENLNLTMNGQTIASNNILTKIVDAVKKALNV